jgi:ammonia channel protein AmtB
MWTDGRTDIKKIIISFRNFAKAPKNIYSNPTNILLCYGFRTNKFSWCFLQLTGIGVILLIVGFLSFNGGSLGTITNPDDGTTVARVMINTLLGASGGSVVILALTKLGFFGPPAWNFSLTVNASIAGMVPYV